MPALTAITFDKHIDGFARTLRDDDSVDLGGFDFITPGGLVPLSLALRQHCSSGKTLRLRTPNIDVRGYLVRAGLFAQFDGRLLAEPPLAVAEQRAFASYRGNNPMLLELTFVHEMEELSPILDKVIETLKDALRYKKTQAFNTAIIISEILQNSLEHSHINVMAPISMQVYKHGAGPRLEIALGDNGIGIKESLRRNRKYRDIRSDEEAILCAIEQGVSECADLTRGNGLRRLMEKVFEHEGTVDIRSGTGKVHFRMDQRKGWQHSVPNLSGTQVVVSLPANQRGAH